MNRCTSTMNRLCKLGLNSDGKQFHKIYFFKNRTISLSLYTRHMAWDMHKNMAELNE